MPLVVIAAMACAQATTPAPSTTPTPAAAPAPAASAGITRPVPSTMPGASPLLAAIASPEASRVADSILALMTLDEKIGQLTMTPAGWEQTGPSVPAGGEQAVREGKIGSFLSFYGAARTRALQRVAVEETRLKIPLIFSHDVIHGWRTIFPVGLAEAATFDSATVADAARIAATEAASFGVHWTFSPMVDVARDPRWGRIVEGGGEDPYLNSVMSAARVIGFQGGSVAEGTSMVATAKHFAAYGGAEGGRDYDVVDVSERTLWEVYLPPFEAAVRAGVGTLMASFNEIGGTPAHASEWLLGDVLRERWGFQGLVVSDWTGVEELRNHGIAATGAEAARRAIRAGVDVEMSSTWYRQELAGLVRSGAVSPATVDSSVHRLLRIKHAMGLFRDPYRYSDTTRERTVSLTAEHRAAARAAARKAIVLLQNDSVPGAGRALPLAATLRSVAVIGPLADDARAVLGPWNGAGRPEDAVTVLAGLRAALPGARVTWQRGVPLDSQRTDSIAAAVALARRSDAVVLVLGENADMSGEAASRASITLPGAQLELARAVARAARAARKPVVAVLLNGRPLAIADLTAEVPAVVESWFLGVEHGHALADVLLGRTNPSGRLPATFPRVAGQVPIHYDRRNTGRPPVADQKYTSKYLDVPWTPLFPFGHGLSYTTFSYAAPRVVTPRAAVGSPVVVEATVRNTGARAGDEVVQLYVRDDAASVTRPLRMLRGFQRVTLAPGESRTVRFTLDREALALHDLDMRRVVEPGTFTVWVGGSAAATAQATFELTGEPLVLAPAPPRMR